MHAQHSALNQQASNAPVQLPPHGFFTFLSRLSGVAPNATDLTSIRINADWLCVVISFACLVFATLEGLAYNNLAQALAGVSRFSWAALRSPAGMPGSH